MQKTYQKLITICLLISSFIILCGIDGCNIYSISGTVSGDVQEGVTIFMSGDESRTTTTNSEGKFSFSGIENGSYIVTPDLSSYTFAPKSESVTIADADNLSVDFTATETVSSGALSTVESIRDNIVTIPSGTFNMGCTDGDKTCDSDESPQHSVTISPFKMSYCQMLCLEA